MAGRPELLLGLHDVHLGVHFPLLAGDVRDLGVCHQRQQVGG